MVMLCLALLTAASVSSSAQAAQPSTDAQIKEAIVKDSMTDGGTLPGMMLLDTLTSGTRNSPSPVSHSRTISSWVR